MSYDTFQILYQAMVKIATAKTFFSDAEKLQQIARNALIKIAEHSEVTGDRPATSEHQTPVDEYRR